MTRPSRRRPRQCTGGCCIYNDDAWSVFMWSQCHGGYLGPTRNCWPLTMVPSPDSASPPSVVGGAAAGSASAIAADLLPILTIWNENWWSCLLSWLKILRLNEWNGCLSVYLFLQVRNKNNWQIWWHGFYSNQNWWDGVIIVSTTPTYFAMITQHWMLTLSTVTVPPSVCLSGCQCCLCLQLTQSSSVSALSAPWHWVAQQVWFGSPWPQWPGPDKVRRWEGGGLASDHGAERSDYIIKYFHNARKVITPVTHLLTLLLNTE